MNSPSRLAHSCHPTHVEQHASYRTTPLNCPAVYAEVVMPQQHLTKEAFRLAPIPLLLHLYHYFCSHTAHVNVCIAQMQTGYCCWQVPFTLKDEDISEDWECKDNKWDRTYAACTMAQALTDAEIDGILAGQQDALEARPLQPAEPETIETEVAEYVLVAVVCAERLQVS